MLPKKRFKASKNNWSPGVLFIVLLTTQFINNSLAAVVVQPLEALVAPVAVQQVVLSKDIKAWLKDQERTTITSYITPFCPASSKIYI